MWEMAFDDKQERQLLSAAERIPDEAVDEVCVSGDPERAIERIEAFTDAGVDTLILIPVGDFEETISHYEETIIPHFQGINRSARRSRFTIPHSSTNDQPPSNRFRDTGLQPPSLAARLGATGTGIPRR